MSGHSYTVLLKFMLHMHLPSVNAASSNNNNTKHALDVAVTHTGLQAHFLTTVTAQGKFCDTCKKPNHFAPVCCKSTATASGLVAHVHYDSSTDAFASSENTEEIKAKVLPDIPNSHTVTLNIFPDSGVNICLAGLRHLQ